MEYVGGFQLAQLVKSLTLNKKYEVQRLQKQKKSIGLNLMIKAIIMQWTS